MFAHHVVIEVEGAPADVLGRIASRLQGSLSREFTAQVVIVPGLVALYWLTFVRRDIALTAVGLRELAAARPSAAAPNARGRTGG